MKKDYFKKGWKKSLIFILVIFSITIWRFIQSYASAEVVKLQPFGGPSTLKKDPNRNVDQNFLDDSRRLQRTVSSEPSYEPNEVLVKFKPFTLHAKSQSVLSSMGMQTVKHYKLVDVYLVRTSPGNRVKDAIEKLKKNPYVRYAEPNYLWRAYATFPNDPDFALQWGLHNTGQTGGTVDADIDAPEAWDVETGESNVVIAVIDTGVDYTHEDLVANIWTNEGEIAGDTIDNDGNGYVDDVHGINAINGSGDPMDDFADVYHGTHCAGIIAAKGNNNTGVSGVCWSAKIMGLKFLDEWGSGWTSDAIECIEYMVNMKNTHGVNVKVSSNSWGGGGYSYALEDAINLAGDNDIVFVAAAGNWGTNNDLIPNYPSGYGCLNIISVAASDYNDTLAYFSQYGYNSVDVTAPGVDIWSAKWGDAYQYLSGTSMATPHVAGLAGLISANNPSLSYLDVKEKIFRTVDPKVYLEDVIASGGRINAYNALTAPIPPGPFIYSLSPGIASYGDEIIIEGTHFGESQGAGYVKFFNNITAPITTWSDNQIGTTVPDGCQSGPVTVTDDGGLESNGKILTLTGSISGSVTDEHTGNPIEAVIDVYDSNWWPISYSWSDSEGDYTVCKLPTGNYYVLAGTLTCYLDEWYDNTLTQYDATLVHVEAPHETPNIDFTLSTGGSISGRITDEHTGNPIEANISVYNSNGWSISYTWSDSEGDYTVCKLPTGNYYVATRGTQTYIGEWYNDIAPCEYAPSAPPVPVNVPNDTPNINFALAFSWEDNFESDNTCSQAKLVTPDGTPQAHTLYPVGDVDWLKFEVRNEAVISIETFDLSPECDTYIYLYDSDCGTILSYDDDSGCGLASKIPLYFFYPGTYFIKVNHYSSSGTGAYKIILGGALDSDGDGIMDYDDNCPTTPNPNQEDTYPPQGNGIGDACDCEGNFDCDQDVDANDVTRFLWDFGRMQSYNPCTNSHQCYGDFSCDGDVDASDVTKFLEDFGRSQYNNPCPVCEVGNWCVYQ